MKRKELLLFALSVFFVCSLSLAQQNKVKNKPDIALEKVVDGSYTIRTYYNTQDNTYTYEIFKNDKIVFTEIILPQLGSSLGYKQKEEVKNEILRIAKFVVGHLREKEKAKIN